MATAQMGKTRSVRGKLEILSSKDIRKQQPWKLMLAGGEGTGKTHFSLTFLQYAYYDLCLNIDEILMVFVDPDAGTSRLLDAGVVEDFLQDRIVHIIPKNWNELMEATDQAYEMLSEHIQKYGERGRIGSLIVVENRGVCWQWAQDDYSESVYGKSLVEKQEDAKKLAVSKDKATQPTFNRMLDYGVINPKYNAWAEGMKNCGFNFIWTAWYKEVTTQKGDGREEIVSQKTEGQRADPGRTDVILKFHIRDGKYLVDLEKRRGLTSRFVDQENVDFSMFVKNYKILQQADRKRREEQFKALEEKRRKILEKQQAKQAKPQEAIETRPADVPQGVPKPPEVATPPVVPSQPEAPKPAETDDTDLTDLDFGIKE